MVWWYKNDIERRNRYMKYAAIPRIQKMSLDASFSSVSVLVRNITVLKEENYLPAQFKCIYA